MPFLYMVQLWHTLHHKDVVKCECGVNYITYSWNWYASGSWRTYAVGWFASLCLALEPDDEGLRIGLQHVSAWHCTFIYFFVFSLLALFPALFEIPSVIVINSCIVMWTAKMDSGAVFAQFAVIGYYVVSLSRRSRMWPVEIESGEVLSNILLVDITL